jgi:ABC-type spermidine/putrescine transport system permease subunit II
MAAGVRRIDESALESLRLEPVSRLRRGLTLLNMTRSSVGAAVLAVTLVMLGSAVPLHVAQLDTYAIALWRRLDLTPPDEQWRVWAGAWPLAVAAIAAGVWVGRRTLLPGEEGGTTGGRAAGSRLTVGAAAAVWCLSVVVPVLLLASNIGDPWFARAFWRTAGEAVTASGLIAAAAGAMGAIIAVATWAGLSGSGSVRTTRAAGLLLLIAGLAPGVVVGVTSATAWNVLGLQSPVAGAGVVVLAHAARLGIVGVLVGAWAFRSLPADERRLMAIDGADGPVGWLRGALASEPGPIIGAALVVGLLSFHEIEAAVMLQPPGLESFSRHMLQLLHYSRYQDLSEAVVVVTGIGVAVGSVIVGVAGWVRR